MARRLREHGWKNPDDITHSIDTRKEYAYARPTRTASCGVLLSKAARVRADHVDCMACISRTTQRERLPPRPLPNLSIPSWHLTDGTRHRMHANTPWRAWCGASLRRATASINPANCTACHGLKKDGRP